MVGLIGCGGLGCLGWRVEERWRQTYSCVGGNSHGLAAFTAGVDHVDVVHLKVGAVCSNGSGRIIVSSTIKAELVSYGD